MRASTSVAFFGDRLGQHLAPGARHQHVVFDANATHVGELRQSVTVQAVARELRERRVLEDYAVKARQHGCGAR